jgi:hypothetical protein
MSVSTKTLPKPSQKVATAAKKSVRTESGEVFTIEKGIPIAGAYRTYGPSVRYPFGEMLAGDSFEIKVSKTEIKAKVSRLSSACTSYVKRANNAAKFTVRRTSADTVRVWRVK